MMLHRYRWLVDLSNRQILRPQKKKLQPLRPPLMKACDDRVVHQGPANRRLQPQRLVAWAAFLQRAQDEASSEVDRAQRLPQPRVGATVVHAFVAV